MYCIKMLYEGGIDFSEYVLEVYMCYDSFLTNGSKAFWFNKIIKLRWFLKNGNKLFWEKESFF